jgi:hypothetical protein
MKLVKPHIKDKITEKFTEVSDPIEDMGIDLKKKYDDFVKTYGLEDAAHVRITALNQAAYQGEYDVVKYILESGIRPDVNDAQPVLEAIKAGNLQMIKLLMEYNVDILKYGDKFLESTVLDGYTYNNKYFEIFEYFLQHGATPGASFFYSMTDSIDKRYYKLIKKYKGWDILKENVNEKFEEESDPIKDMGIGESDKFEKALHDFIASGFEGFWSDLTSITSRGDKLIIEWFHDPYNDNFIHQISGSIRSSKFDKYTVGVTEVQRTKINSFTDKLSIKIKPEYVYIINAIEKVEKKKTFLRGRFFKDKQMYTYEIKINWKEIFEKFTEKSDPIEDMGIDVVSKIMQLSKDFYSFKLGYYTEESWKEIIKWMLEEGYEPWEVLLILNEKIMKWSYDMAGKDIPNTLNDFQNYNVKYMSNRNEDEISRVLNNYKLLNNTWVEQYKHIAKEAGIYAEPMHEKFSETGDPIEDMGIGVFHKRTYKDPADAAKFMYSILHLILATDEIPNDVIYPIDYRDEHGNRRAFKEKYFDAILKYLLKYVQKDYNAKIQGIYPRTEEFLEKVLKKLNEILLMAGYPKKVKENIKESVNEIFTEAPSDPVEDMGIGGYTFETLKPGAIFKVKDNLRSAIAVTKNQSGQFTDWASGMKLFSENRLLIVNVSPKRTINLKGLPAQAEYSRVYKDIIFKKYYVIGESDTKELEYARESIKNGKLPYGGLAGRMIVSKKQFENRFEVIERGFDVNESVNEKFEEHSDPVKDLGIGAITWKNLSVGDHIKSLRTLACVPSIDGNTNSLVIRFEIYRPAHDEGNQMLEIIKNNEIFHINNVQRFGNEVVIDFSLVLYTAPNMWISHDKHTAVITKRQFKEWFKPVNKWELQESVNEKFEEESDPIEDMGIGLAGVREFDTLKEAVKIFVDNIKILTAGKFESKLHLRNVIKYSRDHMTIPQNTPSTLRECKNFLDGQIGERKYEPLTIKELGLRFDKQESKLQFLKDFRDEVIIYALRNSHVDEKFSEEGDPVEDMGIGLYGLLQEEYDKIVKMDMDDRSDYLFKNKTYLAAGNAVKSLLHLIIRDKLLNKRNILNLEETLDDTRKTYGISTNGVNVIVKYFKNKFHIKLPYFYKSIYEKFSEESDPIEDMGIGLRTVIDEWLEENDEGDDVRGGYITAAMFIAENHKDAETVKTWIEYLLREGKEKIQDWEGDYVENMKGADVKFIPNSKILPHEGFSYQIKDGQYYLYTSDWANFSEYFNVHGDVDSEFIEAVLEGDASRYFEYGYTNQQLSDLENSLSQNDEQKLFDYLKPICEEHAGMELEANNIGELLDIVKEDIPEINEALLRAYSNSVAEAEEHAAYKDIVFAIKKELNISEEKYEDNKLILKTNEEGLNKFFTSWYLKDNGIEYWPPQYGWGGDFNLQYFIEDFENALE